MVGWAELPRSPGNAFYYRLQAVLVQAGFDGFAEAQSVPHFADKRGRPSLPPGRYFRMHLVSYDRQRARAGMALRRQPVLARVAATGEDRAGPNHSWLSRTRSRLPLEVHPGIFVWVLQRLAEHGLIAGRPDWRRRLDPSAAFGQVSFGDRIDAVAVDGSQRGAAQHRPPRQRRRLSREAQASGQRKAGSRRRPRTT